MKKISILACLVLLICSSCKKTITEEQSDILARVGNQVLRLSEIAPQIPRGANSKDSLLIAENLIKKWVKDELVYSVAYNNLSDESNEIETLVNNYRRSLYRYKYQERLLRERLYGEIRESDKINYYESNRDKFVLEDNLVKGLFMKVPVNAPNIEELKKWYKSTSNDAVENIEKYSLQNANTYDYFYDRWVDFDEVLEKIPIQLPNRTQFLKNNKTIEYSDSTSLYLLNISEYLPVGSVAPYEYAEPQIQELLISLRKVEFLKEFEEDLYQDAVKKGKVEFFTGNL